MTMMCRTSYAHTVCECVRAGPGEKGVGDSRMRIRLFVYSSCLVYTILHVRYVCSGVYSGVCSGEDEVTRRARATASSARGSRAAVDIEYAAR